MSVSKISRSHMLLFGTLLVLALLAGFVSLASTKAMEKAIISSTSNLMGFRSVDYKWEFLRDGMVLGRMISGEQAVYLFTLRLFGGDHRYALTLQDDGHPNLVVDLGTGPVSPDSARIAAVMRSYVGEPLEGTTALDAIIAHAIMAGIQTIARHERSRKEALIVD